MIRGREAAEIQQLDDALWEGPAEEFLPHGLAGAAQEADQPVLLALEGHEAPHDCLICIGGSAIKGETLAILAAPCFDLCEGFTHAAGAENRQGYKTQN